MTDLEMVRACAEAMGWHTGKPASKVVAYPVNGCAIIAGNDRGGESVYDPLHDDAQCFALVKRFRISIKSAGEVGDPWCVEPHINPSGGYVTTCIDDAPDLNHAICECVAAMQQAKA